MSDAMGTAARRRTVRLVVPLGVVGAFVTAWYTYDGFQKQLCQWDPIAHSRVVRLCDAKYRPTELTAASKLMDAFFRQVGTGKKTDARDMFTTEMRDRVTEERFKAAWPETVVAVERAEPLQAGPRSNEFVVTYRKYDAKTNAKGRVLYTGPQGTVTRFTQTVRFQGSDHGPLIDDFVGSPRATPEAGEGKTRDFPWIEFRTQTAMRRAPNIEADKTQATDIRATKGLRALCRWQTDDQTTWFRTYIGWARQDQVTLGKLPKEGLLNCLTDGFGTMR